MILKIWICVSSLQSTHYSIFFKGPFDLSKAQSFQSCTKSYIFKARNSSPRKTRNFMLRKVIIAFAKPNMSIKNI